VSLGGLLIAAGLAAFAGGALLHRWRAAAEDAAARQAVEIGRVVDEKLTGFKGELKRELEQVADIPQLRSALANRADAETIVDLSSTRTGGSRTEPGARRS